MPGHVELLVNEHSQALLLRAAGAFYPFKCSLRQEETAFKPQKNLGVDGLNNEKCLSVRNPSYCQHDNVKRWQFTAGTSCHIKCTAMNYLANLIECNFAIGDK